MTQNYIDLLKLDATDEKYLKDISGSGYFGFPMESLMAAEEKLRAKENPSIAYFSMEYGLAPSIYHTFKTNNPIASSNILSEHEVFSNMKEMDYYHFLPLKKILDLPIYSGGLGVLAGDTLKSSADLGLSLVGIGILWNKGYFKQKFWFRGGGQVAEELSWDPKTYPGLIPLNIKVKLNLSRAELTLKLWKYYVYSYDLKNVIPLILLDANIDENPEYFRELTAQLYRSDNGWIKIAQRMILGIGGVKALDALGYSIDKYHLNEGHAALAFIEKAKSESAESLKNKFAYTCHTPVEAGHDRFDLQELSAAMGEEGTAVLKKFGRDQHNPHLANLTLLAMNTCGHVNGVAKKHGDVMRIQFPKYREMIKSITNGIHTHTWMSRPIRELLLKYKDVIGDIEKDPTQLKNVLTLKSQPEFRAGLWQAHLENKKALAEFLKFWFFNDYTFTIGWARRFAPYKRPTLLLQDINKLIQLSKNIGPMQIVIAGKAHPQDAPASRLMDEMLEKITQLDGEMKSLKICFLENYDTYFAKLLTSSVDVWLNNPIPPFEASGTSGMKAIANGVIQLSTLDGWVVEAADKGIGRIFGYVPPEGHLGSEHDTKMAEDSKELYKKLEELMPLYYTALKGRLDGEWVDMMINCIAQGAYFSTQRMVSEYKQMIWF